MTGWQLTLCYGLTILAILILAAEPPKGPVVNLPVQPRQVVYVTPVPLPDRNPNQ